MSGIYWSFELLDESEFVFAFFEKAWGGQIAIFGGFGAVYRDGVAFEELAAFALATRETGLDEDVKELGAFCGGREALREQFDFVGAEVGNLAFAKEDGGDFLGRIGSSGAVNEFSDFVGEQALAIAGAWVFVVLGDNLAEFFWGDDGVILEVFFERIVGLVEPELVKIKDTGLFAVEPDGVTFGFAELAAGDLIDDKWTGVGVSLGIFEAADEVDARSTVAVLVSTTEL